jgi:hypothetical protein
MFKPLSRPLLMDGTLPRHRDTLFVTITMDKTQSVILTPSNIGLLSTGVITEELVKIISYYCYH